MVTRDTFLVTCVHFLEKNLARLSSVRVIHCVNFRCKCNCEFSGDTLNLLLLVPNDRARWFRDSTTSPKCRKLHNMAGFAIFLSGECALYRCLPDCCCVMSTYYWPPLANWRLLHTQESERYRPVLFFNSIVSYWYHFFMTSFNDLNFILNSESGLIPS